MAMTVDAVYTWIGADDAERSALRRRWEQREGSALVDAAGPRRHIDHDELRFSLRSVVRHAPFVRRVYVVTSGGQRPAWAVEHPRLTWVDDTAIFPDTAHLPTFNSQAIETHLHRIEGLADYFVYFNDDMFVGRPTRLADFVAADGRTRVCFDSGWGDSPEGAPSVHDNSFVAAWRNNNSLLNHRFGPQRRPFPVHQGSILRRADFDGLWHDPVFRDAMQRTSASRFRRRHNVAPVGLAQYYGLHTGGAVPAQTNQVMVSVCDHPEHVSLGLADLTAQQPMLFCLNDDTDQPPTEVWQLVRDFLQAQLPEPSPFETQAAV